MGTAGSSERRSEGPAWRAEVARAMRPWRGAGVVLAVSGGADSVAMLEILGDLAPGLDLRLSVAHLDHGVRGEVAEADARFVAGLAQARSLPFDLGRWQPERPGHFEADARKARYGWLAEVARRREAWLVAVAHTRDDQAETILHRILRGTGPRGLAGMPGTRPLADGVTLIRPLLDAGREDLRAFLRDRGRPWREDASNADLGRTRARLRHDLLPKLAAEYNPKVAEALVRLGRIAGEGHEAMVARLAAELSATRWRLPDGSLALDTGALADLPPEVRADVIRVAWREAGWPEGGMTARHWLRIARRSQGGPASESTPDDRLSRLEFHSQFEGLGRRLDVGGGVVAEFGPGVIVLRPPVESERQRVPFLARFEAPGALTWGTWRIEASLDPQAPAHEAIDLDRLEPFAGACGWGMGHPGSRPDPETRLIVRAPIHGDRFEPLGLGGKSQALNDFFRGRGVAWADRRAVPLVCDRRGIVWVVGHRIADRVKRTEATRRVLRLSARRSDALGDEAGTCG